MSNVLQMRDSKGILWERGKSTRPSEGELADRFAERHSREVRFLAAAGRVHGQRARKAGWIRWSGADGESLADTANLALHLARGICREAASAFGDPAIDSHRSAAGVVALAKCDPRIACADWPCDPQIEAAVDAWISDRCILAAEEWTPRADLLASFPNWQQFDPDDLTAALDARGISYRRKANTHGFDGVRLKGDDDE
jgi:hypothetical protein